MEIEKVELFKVYGITFDSPEKAMDYVESLLLKHVDAMINESGALAKSSIKMMEYILKHKKALAELLSIEPYREE